MTQVFVVVLVLCILSANELPCFLIPHECSGSRSVLDLSCFKFAIFEMQYLHVFEDQEVVELLSLSIFLLLLLLYIIL